MPLPSDPLFDTLVIGGGIVGSSIARDAAMRGLSVALVDRGDFASGTSSRSSRLLHGGIRYLAQGRVPLVREASREKMILGRIAPHLTHPLAFVFPTRKQSPWQWWKLRAGTSLYDLLCGKKNYGPSRGFNREDTLAYLPGLNPDNLTGAVRYFDAFTNDARLVMDTLRSAAKHGAHIANYTGFEDATYDSASKHWVCSVRDTLDKREFEIRARTVVNAAGAWADGIPHSHTRLRPTKGAHIVIDRAMLPVPDAVVMPEPGTERILFAIPWGTRTVLGTTDTDYVGDPAEITCTAQDIEYILKITNQSFPEAKITADHVKGTWAGLRPLVMDRRGKPSDISRKHEIALQPNGWCDVTGGKLTTCRLMAEQTVNGLGTVLDQWIPPCHTADEPILPPEETHGISGILPQEPSEALIRHFIDKEWARTTEDILWRRSSWLFYRDDLDQLIPRITKALAN